MIIGETTNGANDKHERACNGLTITFLRFCQGCVLREQQRVAEDRNGRVPKWLRCMACREKTSFRPDEPKYHRLLIDLLGRAQQYASAQIKREHDCNVASHENAEPDEVEETKSPSAKAEGGQSTGLATSGSPNDTPGEDSTLMGGYLESSPPKAPLHDEHPIEEGLTDLRGRHGDSRGGGRGVDGKSAAAASEEEGKEPVVENFTWVQCSGCDKVRVSVAMSFIRMSCDVHVW